MNKNKEKKIAQKLYSKIDLYLRENNLNRYEVANKMGHRKQAVSEILLKLKDGKFPRLQSLLKLQEALEMPIIFFNL
nr:MAG TPA: DNA-binding protein [Caudoviricetes sp.]